MQHAVADETMAHAHQYTDLADATAQVHDSGNHFIGGLLTTHVFQQLHHVGGAEEVHAHHVFGTAGEAGNAIHVQGGGVGGENGAGFADPIQLTEHGLFYVHVLEHRFDHQVHIAQVVVAEGGLNQRHALLHLLLGNAPFLRGVFVVLADDGDALFQGLFFHLENLHRNARIGEVHGDTAAHGARADHRRLLDLALGGILVQSWHLGHFPFGEEHMTLGRGFAGNQQLEEQLPFPLHALVVGQFHRCLDRLDTGKRRLEAALFSGNGLLEMLEQLGTGIPGHVQFGDLAQRRAISNQLAGKGQCPFQQIAADHLVHQTQLPGLGCLDGVASHDHFQGFLCPHQTRQALGATGTGQQAQLHFRQAQAGAVQGHAIIAAQRHFQPATQGCAMDGSDHRLVAGFVFINHRGQYRLLGRLAEFTDIGAGREGLALADHHHRLDAIVRQGLA